MKFGQWYLSEKVALSLSASNVFTRYRRQILYILKSQKGSIEALNNSKLQWNLSKRSSLGQISVAALERWLQYAKHRGCGL